MNAFTVPSPDEFLTWSSRPEEDEEPTPITDPLVSIAESLQTLAAEAVQQNRLAEGRLFGADPAPSTTTLDEIEMRALNAEAARDDIEAQLYEAHGKLEEIRALVKPSTSKLANAIRAVLAPPTPEVAEEGEPEAERELPEGVYVSPTSDATVTVAVPAANAAAMGLPQPAHDAPIEEWVAYAQARGLDIDPGRTNRSQIRTLLGIAQPVEATS